MKYLERGGGHISDSILEGGHISDSILEGGGTSHFFLLTL